MLIFFAFDNDDMESSKRCVTFLSLIFLLKCMLKQHDTTNNMKNQTGKITELFISLNWLV